MEFRRFSGKRALQRPSFDQEDLEPYDGALKGALTMVEAFIRNGQGASFSVEGHLSRVLVDGGDLTKSRWSEMVLDDVALTKVNASGSDWKVEARRVELEGCRATALRLDLDLAHDVYVGDSKLDFASIAIGKTKGLVVFERCDLTEASIVGDLSNVLFIDCDLSRCEFEATRAEGCDLTGSKLDGLQGLVSLRGASLSLDQARGLAEQLAAEVGLKVA